MKPDRSRATAYAALTAGVLSLGFSPVLLRWAGAPGVVASFYRMAVAVGVLAAPFFVRVRRLGHLPRRGVGLAVLGGVLFALDNVAWASGVMLSGAANPTLMANTAPVWVGIGAGLLLGETLQPTFWIGLGVALVGAAVVLGLDALRSASLGFGTALGLAASVFYAGYFLVTQRGRAWLDSLTYFWLSVTCCMLCLLVMSLAFGVPLAGYSPRTYLGLLALGLLVQVVGWFLITFAQGHLPASVVSPSLLVQPVIAALLAVPLLGEGILPLQVVGGAIVLGGMLLVHRSRWRESAPERERIAPGA